MTRHAKHVLHVIAQHPQQLLSSVALPVQIYKTTSLQVPAQSMQSAHCPSDFKSTACKAADLRAEPGIPLSVELGDGDEGLQALAAADQAPLVHIQHLDREGLLVLHHNKGCILVSTL